jgi:hypothetical protein
VSQCDVVTVNAPLHAGTRGLVNADLLKHFKKGAWLVNTARGAICDADDVAAALKSGQLSGYSGDVWNVQPAPREHPWRTMKNPLGGGNGMVPHYSGTTLDAQARYASGTKSIIQNYFEGKEQEPANIIVGKKGYESKACECLPRVSSRLYLLLTSAQTASASERSAASELECAVFSSSPRSEPEAAVLYMLVSSVRLSATTKRTCRCPLRFRSSQSRGGAGSVA